MAASKKSGSKSGSTKNGKTVGSTRTAPKKTAEYKSKNANKNKTSSSSSSSKDSYKAQQTANSNMSASDRKKASEAQGYVGRGAIKTTGTKTPTEQVAQQPQVSALDQQQQSAIDYINSTDLPADLKSFYTTAIENWDPNTELNTENIIKEFKKIKNSTISPHFQGLADLAIASVENAAKGMEAQRAVELESELANSDAEMRNAQASLEASGLTFSGEAVRNLGTEKAATVPFGGATVEGLLPQKNRLISTSSAAAYKQNLKNLGLSAEEQLGSSRTKSLIDGYSTVGGVTGSLKDAQDAAEGAALGNLLNQGISNVSQNQSLSFSS